jgi:hypothetical protein
MSKKQAVLLIHGIGEQRPMDSLRGFVDTVWTTDSEAKRNPRAREQVWSKPDSVSESFELRRMTTTQNTEGVRTDFFEFYWAHLLQDTKIERVAAWAKTLLFRRPSKVPSPLIATYSVLWALVFLGLYLVLNAAVHSTPLNWAMALFVVLGLPLLKSVVTDVVGDAARYLHRAPPNIQSRIAIRQAGLKVLLALHERDYERIVVVGHSLGSIIGYDILTYAWAHYNESPPSASPSFEALNAVEALGRAEQAAPLDAAQIAAAQAAQSVALQEHIANGNRWRVTDFVTMGSPLAHAEVLLADNATDLQKKQQSRELMTCPPVMELIPHPGIAEKRFSYFQKRESSPPVRTLHHAAAFAVTRWTNLYFPCKAILFGDVIGGPLAPVLGRWIRDIKVHSQQRFGLFQHTLYWRRPTGQDGAEHIEALREALRI